MPFRIIRVITGALLVLFVASACSLSDNSQQVAMVFEGAPTIEIASPLPGSVYREGTSVNILARVDNAGEDVARVEIRAGTELVAEGNNPNTSGAAAFTVTSSWVASRAGNQTISILVSRTDGTSSVMETVDIEVRGTPVPTATPTVTVAPTSTVDTAVQPEQPTQPPEQTAPQTEPTTAPAEPTAEPATATSSVPRVRVKQGANIRSGPSTVFDPPIGSLASGAEVDLLGQNPGATWYKIQYYNREAWIAAVTVDLVGDVTNLPIDVGPATPMPTLPPPTAAPVNTAVPAGGADLVVDGTPNISPHPFECGKSSEVYINIKNIGTQASNGGRALLQDMYKGNPNGNTSINFGPVQPGQSVTLGPLYLTVSTYVSEAHTTRIVVDADNQTPESNEGNNQYDSQPYSLGAGNC